MPSLRTLSGETLLIVPLAGKSRERCANVLFPNNLPVFPKNKQKQNRKKYVLHVQQRVEGQFKLGTS